MSCGLRYAMLLAVTLALIDCAGRAQAPVGRGQSPDSLAVRMREPAEPYRMGPPNPEWTGRAVVSGTSLMFEFPVLESDNIGCGFVDSAPPPARRRYYWLATATYPGSQYPLNHFQQVRLDFSLPRAVVPTKARLDSAFRAARLYVIELLVNRRGRSIPLRSSGQAPPLNRQWWQGGPPGARESLWRVRMRSARSCPPGPIRSRTDGASATSG